MSTRLGPLQIRRLASIAVGMCQVVPDSVSRSLTRRGLMEPTGSDGESLVVVTPAGLRALADAMDAGRFPYKPDWDAIKASRSDS
jgi:hypothetical protein